MRNKRSQSPCPAIHPACIMSIIWVMSFGFVPGTHHQHHHLRDAFFPAAARSSQCTGDHKRASIGTHHGHHPGDGFSVLFVWALPTCNKSPTYEQQEITKPVPCNPTSAHHEHHPGDGFSVLFFWALPTATRVPLMRNKRSQSPCPATHPARIMSIIWVMSFGFVPGTHHQHHHLRDAFFSSCSKVLSMYRRSQKSIQQHAP